MVEDSARREETRENDRILTSRDFRSMPVGSRTPPDPRSVRRFLAYRKQSQSSALNGAQTPDPIIVAATTKAANAAP